MKTITISILAFLLPFAVYSQTIIEQPRHGLSTAPYLTIKKIEIGDTTTVLYFHTTFTPGNWINIPKETYIQPIDDSIRSYIVATEGIPLGKKYTMPESGEVDYKLIFPKINPDIRKLDYGEANDGGSWFIYDIQLKPSLNPSRVPQELSGNWFNTESGDWEFGFFDSTAIFNEKLWKYGEVKLKRGEGSIELNNKMAKSGLYVKKGTNGHYLIGESPLQLREYCNDASKNKLKPRVNDKPFEASVFKSDSAIYSGCIKGYTSRVSMKTFIVYVNDIITGEQNPFLVRLSDDGSFSLKIPLYYPHEVYVRSPFFNGSVFLEPGKELFQLFDSGNEMNKNLFMGECARINTDLHKLEKINGFNYTDMQNKILDMTPVMYKSYCMDQKQKDLDALEAYIKDHSVSAKASQVQILNIEYRNAANLMAYKMYFEGAYRKKNNIPNTQRTLPVNTENLTAGYYDFLSNELVNDPLAVLSNDYDHFLNRLKYLELLRGENKGFSTLELVYALQETGYSFTDEEKKWVDALKEKETPESIAAEKEFREKYGTPTSDFYRKYMDKMQELFKEKKGDVVTFRMIENHLIEKGVELTNDDKVLIEALKANENTEASLKEREFQKQYKSSIEKFYSDHNSFLNSWNRRRSKLARNEKLEKMLGVHKGFATDIMDAQDECRAIGSEMTPVSDKELKTVQQQISTPFIAEYIALCNRETLARIEANKDKKGFTVNEVPTTEADQLFEGMMMKYRGKVVYVDFWATWCGPCRSGIEQIKPLKEELANKNVVFVYITNQTSPQQTWENMIPDIKGEHFRVSPDEWNYLSGKFNISGIPHTVLVDKEGVILNPHLGYMDNQSLKNMLEKQME